MFKGVIVALVTPFRNGAVDFEAIDDLVEFHVAEGTDALLPLGTTGESPTLSAEERDAVIQRVVRKSAGRITVIAGAGANSTPEAVSRTLRAKASGATAALHVTPYYNKPSQEGLYRHFETVARDGGLPVILYNVPGRTGVDLKPETVERLARIDEIVAIKEASGSVDRVSEIVSMCPDFHVLSGDDSLTLPMLSVGARGVISVVANLVPGKLVEMLDMFWRGNVSGAMKAHLDLFPLTKAMFVETNPVPVKEAMAMLGKITPEVRPPLAPLSEANREKLRDALEEFELL